MGHYRDPLEQKIRRAIADHDILLVVISPASLNSAWVRKEISIALEKEAQVGRVCIIPVFLEKAVQIEGLKERVGVVIDGEDIAYDALWSLLAFLTHDGLKPIALENSHRHVIHFLQTYPDLRTFHDAVMRLELPRDLPQYLVDSTIDKTCLAQFCEAMLLSIQGKNEAEIGHYVKTGAPRILCEIGWRTVSFHNLGAENLDRMIKSIGDFDEAFPALPQGGLAESVPARVSLMLNNRAKWRTLYLFVEHNIDFVEPVLNDLIAHILTRDHRPKNYKVELAFQIMRRYRKISSFNLLLDQWIDFYFEEFEETGDTALYVFLASFARGYEDRGEPFLSKIGLMKGQLKSLIESRRDQDAKLLGAHFEALTEMARTNPIGRGEFTQFLKSLDEFLNESTDAPHDAELAAAYFELKRALRLGLARSSDESGA